MKKPAIFVDRDGTICREVNYLSRPEDLEVFSFSAKAIKLLNKDFLVILITNQSGITRGFIDESAFHKINEKLALELKKGGAKLDMIYYCPHVSEDNCHCRKPKIGMLDQAVKDFQIDLNKSWVIGDKASDVETGINAGTKTALVLTGYGQKELAKLKRKTDLVEANLLDSAKKIIKIAEF